MPPRPKFPSPNSPCTSAIYIMDETPKPKQDGGLRVARVESIQPPIDLDNVRGGVADDIMRSKLADERFNSFAATRHIVLGIMSVLVLPIFACEGVIIFGRMRRDPFSSVVVAGAGLMKIGMLYQVLSERVKKLQKWANLKAGAVLNIVSAVVFPLLVALMAIKISKSCVGTTCTLSWIMLGCCAGESILAPLLAFIAMHRFLWYRKTGWRQM
ncbi:hypothetical protein C1H76_1397 [Elsinoe australis]|uniref:Uncharacterized protein n=1 Tax=Elsinoe australis TaxID=40998 RepID=A0A4U7B956_9PEZI|nr:hypothetical protein C1H76_1397 [Elsinoe australis]